MLNHVKKSFTVQLMLIIFAGLLIQLALIAVSFYSISADESDRSIQAYNWFMGNTSFDEAWLPLHKIILGSGFYILQDLFWTPRIVTALFGILLIPLTAWLADEIFGSKKIAIISALLSCFFFPRIIFTAVPLTESIFIVIILAAFSFYIRYLNIKKNVYLLASSILFSLSCSIRYEGWLISASFGLLIIYHFVTSKPKINRNLIWGILILLSAFPFYWLCFQYFETGSALSFLYSTTDNYSRTHGGSIITQIKNSLVPQFIFQNLISLNILGIIAILSIWNKSVHIKYFLLLFFVSITAMSAATIIGKALPSHNFWRVPAVWSFLLLPFTAYFINNYKTFFSAVNVHFKKIIIIIFILFNFGMTFYEVNKRSAFTEEHKLAGKYLYGVFENDENKKVLIETSSWGYIHIRVSSQYPNNFIYNTGPNPGMPTESLLESNKNLAELKEKGITHFLFKSPHYRLILKNNSNIKLLKEFTNWSLYTYK